MKKRILLIGGGGHCRSVSDTIISGGLFDEIGVVDKDTTVANYVGNDDDLPKLFDEGWKYAFITVGSIGDTRLRRKLCALAEEIGFEIPTIIDGSAVVSDNSRIGGGTFIGKRAVVNTNAEIGKCCIINSGAILEHDCIVGDFVHIAPGAIVCGEASIGDNSHIGTGASLRNQIKIGKNCLIGIGSAVVGDIPDNALAYGNPCKVKK